jgi:hypothetical protein
MTANDTFREHDRQEKGDTSARPARVRSTGCKGMLKYNEGTADESQG